MVTPAARSARAALSSVAPVVNTSSTSSQWPRAVAGAPCEGATDAGTEPLPIAFFRLVAYSSRSAEKLGEMDAGPNADCVPSERSGAIDEPRPLVATPDPEITGNFVTLFSNPT